MEKVIEPKVEKSTVKEFTVTAKKWEFTPNPIEVNKGDTVILNVRSVDVTHGIIIPEFGVDERLQPGTVVVIEFIADKEGEFNFYCNVPCGSGHSGMMGKIIVK